MIFTFYINQFLFFFLIFCLLVQLIYFWGIFSRFAFKKEKPVKIDDKETQWEPVSVVICAKNEARYLKMFLPVILEQDYPEFEVLVVDDNSDDNLSDELIALKNKYSNLQVLQISNSFNQTQGKRLALALGIKSAKHNLILLTDADCWPNSSQWIKAMVSKHTQQKRIVLGYGAYEMKKGFLDKLVRYDTLHTAIQYFSFALIHQPYMGVGRNMLYEKSLYMQNNGYLIGSRSISGDDDLFVNAVATGDNTDCIYHPIAHTVSVQRNNKLSQWLFQKKRHFSASKFYKPKNKFVLGLYWASNCLFYFLLILSLIFSVLKWQTIAFLLGVYILKVASQWIIFAKASNKLAENELIKYLPLLDLIFIVLVPFLHIILLFKKQKRWN